MLIRHDGLLGRLLHKAMLARWRRTHANAAAAPLSALRAQRFQARQLRHHLREVCHVADDRLGLPQIGSTAFPLPIGTDWSWRPVAWRVPLDHPGVAPAPTKAQLGDEVALFHDCPHGEIALRQSRNHGEDDLAPFGLQLEIFHFAGSFLSLVIDVPPEACLNLRKRHLVHIAAVIEREQPIRIFARLNIKNGPNTEQILLTLPDDTPHTMVEFDLAYTQLNEKRTEKMWVDLMFENPSMNRITLRDVALSRYPRAEI